MLMRCKEIIPNTGLFAFVCLTVIIICSKCRLLSLCNKMNQNYRCRLVYLWLAMENISSNLLVGKDGEW